MLEKKLDVILCKGSSDKNESQKEYVQLLESAGYNCDILTTLSFEFENLDALKASLLKPESYSGLILTSPRAVESINNALKNENIHDQWANLPTYCVGSTTENLAKKFLNSKACEGSHCGNSKDLADYILTKKSDQNIKPLLYPCSKIARDTIEKILTNNKINIDKKIVYKTLPARTLKEDLTKIIKPTPQIFVFFSPSSVEYLIKVASENSILLDNIKAVAIGPVTAEAITKAKFQVFAVAQKPGPKALLAAVKMTEIQINDLL